MKNETIAGFLGTLLLSLFLLGLANSIGKTPFWVIVILVLLGAWFAWFQDTIKNPDAE